MNARRTKVIAVPLLIATCSSCSWLFMSKPDNKYAAGTEPDCTTGAGWVVVDAVIAGANIISALAVGVGPPDDSKALSVGIGVVGALVHLASAGTGASWAAQCRGAMAKYERNDDGISAADEAERRRLESRLARDEAKRLERERKAEPPPVAPVQRGFFCASSEANATVGFCVRDKAECQRTRDVSLEALPDLTECTLTERAFCFGDRCAPTAEACDAMWARVIGPDGTGQPCADSE